MSPKAKTKLTERAMLVDFSAGYWRGRRKDEKVGDEVKAEKRAEKDTGSWWTRVVPKRHVSPVQNAVMRGRVLNAQMTLPWGDDGVRVLPAEMFMEYTKKMRKAEAEFNKAVDGFIAAYPEILREAKERLGDLYRKDAFPRASQLRRKYHWAAHFRPIPDAADFRVDLGAETNEAIRKDIEANTKSVLEDAMKDLWQRLFDKVTHMAERLSAPKAIFRDSMISNLADLCEMLPKMNITNDPKLEKARREIMKKLAKQSPTELRDSKEDRHEVAKTAKTIASKMATFLGKKG